MSVKGSVMGKDPAVSWVFNDWQGGTMTLSRFQKGCYMDLLTAQFNNGHLTLDEIKNVLGNDFAAWGVLSKKFAKDSEEKFYNERLEFEIIKRKSFNKSRRKNLDGDNHMGSGNEKGNDLGNEININERKENFSFEVAEKIKTSELEMLNSFIDYWTEHNSNGKKMRFEMEKVFDINRRWGTWVKNNTNFKSDFTKKENGTGKQNSKGSDTANIISRIAGQQGI